MNYIKEISKKRLHLIAMLLFVNFLPNLLWSQGGSNIRYHRKEAVKINKNKYLNKPSKIDFYSEQRGFISFMGGLDTIKLPVLRDTILFRERRFYQIDMVSYAEQYLQSVDLYLGKISLKIDETTLVSIENSIWTFEGKLFFYKKIYNKQDSNKSYDKIDETYRLVKTETIIFSMPEDSIDGLITKKTKKK